MHKFIKTSKIDRQHYLFSIVLFIFSVGYLTTFYKYGLNLWDEGALLNGSLRSYNGEISLLDFNGYMPGRYLLGAFMFKLFGVTISVIRFPILLMTALAVTLMYNASRKIMPNPFAILSACMFLIAPAVYYNRFFPIFSIINIFAILDYIDKKTTKRLLILFCAIAITLFFKLEISVISLLTSGVVIIAMDGKKHLIPFIVSALFLLTCIIFFAGYEHLIGVYKFIFKTHKDWGNPFPPIFSTDLWSDFRSPAFFRTTVFYMPPLIYLASAGLSCKFHKERNNNNKKNPFIVAVLLFGIMTYGLVVWRAGFDNLIRVLPATWILTGYLLYGISIKLKEKGIPNILIGALILFIPLWYANNILFHSDFYSGSIGELRKEHSEALSIKNNVYGNPVEAEWIDEVTMYIEENSQKGDYIFAIPLNAIWYFFSDRQNPTYYEWILPGMTKDKSLEEAVLKSLNRKKPSLVISADLAIDNKEERRFSNYSPKIYAYIKRNYNREKRVGFFDIWKRKKILIKSTL